MSPAAPGKTRTIVIAAAAAFAVALLGGLMTDIGPWYYALEKPPWQPPEWLFGPAWTLIFALAALAGALSWWGSDTRISRQNLLLWFLLNGILNVLWSLLFFGLKRPDWALSEVALLWLSIVVLIVVCARRNRTAAWLLAPYLGWVTFAAFLNLEIVRLNGPFAGG